MGITHGSLFSGIGGFDLGFERAGIETVWQVEIEDYCRRVLARHFPRAKRYDDIRTVGSHNLEPVEIITGGFPCQPFSCAGERKGEADSRYLWPEMFRVISELRPTFVLAENVRFFAALEHGRYLDQVYDDLESIGYETVPPIILPACAFGAGHRRDRLWIVAHADRDGQRRIQSECRKECSQEVGTSRPSTEGATSNANRERQLQPQRGVETLGGRISDGDWWSANHHVLGLDDGLPATLDEIRGLGNAIVPQIAEWIGRRIVEAVADGGSTK